MSNHHRITTNAVLSRSPRLLGALYATGTATALLAAIGCTAAPADGPAEVVPLVDIQLADGARVSFTAVGSTIVIAEDTRNGVPFPLDAVGASGKTSLDLFHALRPDDEAPPELVAAQAAEAALLAHATAVQPHTDKTQVANARSNAQCQQFVFDGFVPWFPRTLENGCRGGGEASVVASTNSSTPWAVPGDAARVGFCNNNDSRAAASSWSVSVWNGSAWGAPTRGPNDQLPAGFVRRYQFNVDSTYRKIFGIGVPADPFGNPCSIVVASAGGFSPD